MIGKISAGIEIKSTERKYISANAVLPHQKKALLECTRGGTGRGYVVACFLHKDVRKALVINIKDWQGATPDSPSEFSLPL